jgi:mevalonate kinase
LRSGQYYSKGKFLLSGEYFVLYGAKALAVPLKYGQKMTVEEIPDKGLIRWTTHVMDKLWFTAVYSRRDFEILQASDEMTAIVVQNLLKEGSKLQPGLNLENKGFFIQNHIDFDLNWGLGSSSSLVSNLSFWLELDPYALYRAIYQGSGYDVFCARAEKPIIYQLHDDLPLVVESSFRPSFTEKLYFIYLGRKQDSQESVRKFRAYQYDDEKVIGEISALTGAMEAANSLDDFLKIMHDHEEILSKVLGLPGVKPELFPDFNGEIKSLGAWGGDFVMAASTLEPEEVRQYFLKKDMPVFFKWKEIVYQEKLKIES